MHKEKDRIWFKPFSQTQLSPFWFYVTGSFACIIFQLTFFSSQMMCQKAKISRNIFSFLIKLFFESTEFAGNKLWTAKDARNFVAPGACAPGRRMNVAVTEWRMDICGSKGHGRGKQTQPSVCDFRRRAHTPFNQKRRKAMAFGINWHPLYRTHSIHSPN